MFSLCAWNVHGIELGWKHEDLFPVVFLFSEINLIIALIVVLLLAPDIKVLERLGELVFRRIKPAERVCR